MKWIIEIEGDGDHKRDDLEDAIHHALGLVDQFKMQFSTVLIDTITLTINFDESTLNKVNDIVFEEKT